MKKIYNAPEADLLCFRPMEDLAADIDFGTLIGGSGYDTSGAQTAAGTSAGDIKITIGK